MIFPIHQYSGKRCLYSSQASCPVQSKTLPSQSERQGVSKDREFLPNFLSYQIQSNRDINKHRLLFVNTLVFETGFHRKIFQDKSRISIFLPDHCLTPLYFEIKTTQKMRWDTNDNSRPCLSRVRSLYWPNPKQMNR